MRRPPIFLTILLISALSAEGRSMALDAASVDDTLAEHLDRIVEIRHTLHQNPELGNREVATAALIAQELRAAGLEVTEEIAHTGVVGVLRGTRPEPIVAIRADMDALPVTEATDLPFRSTRRAVYLGQEVGVAHACGHDIHTSVALGAAKVLAALRADLAGTVLFIFQPAEEGPPPGERGGSELMLEEGVFSEIRPTAIFGLHAWPGMGVGQVGYREGAIMAAVDHFVVKIRGRQTHGAMPHLGVDPIVMAAQAIQAFQTIRSRNLSPIEPSVVTVGIVRGGERFNIIPDEVHLEGTVRTFSSEAREAVKARIEEILDGVTRAGGGSYEISLYQMNAPATINHSELSRRARSRLERALGVENVIDVDPSTGGEDFAYFANEVPGFYFHLGIEHPNSKSGGLHTPTFRADDGAIEVGIRAMVNLALGELER